MTATEPRSPLYGEVLHEVVALDWSSHGKGATVPEVQAALRLRGVHAPLVTVSCVCSDLISEGALRHAGIHRSWSGEGWPVVELAEEKAA